jgi:hypothetical protein
MFAMTSHGDVTCSSFRKRRYRGTESPSVPPRRNNSRQGMSGPNLAPQEIVDRSPVVHRVHAEVTFAGSVRPDRLAHCSSAATITSAGNTESGPAGDRSMLRDNRAGCIEPIVSYLGAYPLARSTGGRKSSDDRPPWLAEPRPYATEVFRTVEP